MLTTDPRPHAEPRLVSPKQWAIGHKSNPVNDLPTESTNRPLNVMAAKHVPSSKRTRKDCRTA